MINLQQGDCLSLMKDIPDKSIDLLLTDPPYNISKNNNFKTMGRSGLQFGDWDHGFNLTSWLTGINRIMNDGSSIIIFNAWRNLGVLDNKLNDEGFIGKDVFRWIKPLMPLKRYLGFNLSPAGMTGITYHFSSFRFSIGVAINLPTVSIKICFWSSANL